MTGNLAVDATAVEAVANYETHKTINILDIDVSEQDIVKYISLQSVKVKMQFIYAKMLIIWWIISQKRLNVHCLTTIRLKYHSIAIFYII